MSDQLRVSTNMPPIKQRSDHLYGAQRDNTMVAPTTSSSHALLRLQEKYGNRYVQRVVELSRHSQSEVSVTPEAQEVLQQSRTGDQSPDSSASAQMKLAFGGVRMHADRQSDSLNCSLSVRAFIPSQDIFFKHSEYNPSTPNEHKLLAQDWPHIARQTSLAQVSQLQSEEATKQHERIWKRDPFAKWGERGNRGVSWGSNGPIPKEYRGNVIEALDLVYGLGKNKVFLQKFYQVVMTTSAKGTVPQVNDLWELVSFFFETLDKVVLHLANTSEDSQIKDLIKNPSPGGPEEGFSYPGRPDVWLMEYRLKQGPRKIANTIIHEAAHVAGVSSFLGFELMIQAIEKASGFPR